MKKLGLFLLLAALMVCGGRHAVGQTDPKIAGLIAGLGSDEFQTREKAKKELIALGGDAKSTLQFALKSDDPEVAHQAQMALYAIELVPLPKSAREAAASLMDAVNRLSTGSRLEAFQRTLDLSRQFPLTQDQIRFRLEALNNISNDDLPRGLDKVAEREFLRALLRAKAEFLLKYANKVHFYDSAGKLAFYLLAQAVDEFPDELPALLFPGPSSSSGYEGLVQDKTGWEDRNFKTALRALTPARREVLRKRADDYGDEDEFASFLGGLTTVSAPARDPAATKRWLKEQEVFALKMEAEEIKLREGRRAELRKQYPNPDDYEQALRQDILNHPNIWGRE